MSGTELRVPANAELVNGKWWTPKMVMHFWGYTQSTFYKKSRGKTLKQMLYASNIRARVGERSFSDRSKTFMAGNREWTFAMIYYYMIRNRYIDPEITTYASFRSACYSYASRDCMGGVKLGIDINCQRYGCNIWRSLANVTQEQYDRFKERYVDYINKHKHSAHAELPQYFDPNDRYMECVQVDPRMMHIYHAEVLKRLPRVEKELAETQEMLQEKVQTILTLKHELAQMQKSSFEKIKRLEQQVSELTMELHHDEVNGNVTARKEYKG